VRWPKHDAASLAAYQLKAGDVIVGMDRPLIAAGVRVAVITKDDLPSLLLQRVVRLRSRDDLIQAYVPPLIGGKGFADYLTPIFTGISVPHMSPRQLRGFIIALPPLVEQRAILDSVAKEIERVLAIEDRTREEITLLSEYRTRLIADVVTGKLDVRAAAARLPEEPEDESCADDDPN
jgi:type I restriction enzyme S subunit